LVALKIPRFKNAEHARTVWQAMSEHGEKLEDIMRPEYWANVARNLKPGDRIEVIAEDNAFFAEFHVFGVAPFGAKIGLLRYEVFAENAAEQGMTDLGIPEYEVKWGFNYHKWMVKRVSDGQTMVAKLASKKEAEDWLLEYRKSLAR
jgi:hypothetical protein